MTPEERFWSRTVPGPGGCILWTGARSKKGYALFHPTRPTLVLGHRYAYRTRHPLGREKLDHTCRVRHCVNPDHLEPVTTKTNNQRGLQTYANGLTAVCRKGLHDVTTEHALYVFANGKRRCRECVKAYQRARYRKAA